MKQKNIITFFLCVAALIAVIELSKFSFNLMNQPDSFLFYAGFTILSVVVLGIAVIAYRAIGRIMKGSGLTKDDPTDDKVKTPEDTDKNN